MWWFDTVSGVGCYKGDTMIRDLLAWVTLTGFFALGITLMEIIRPLAIVIEYWLQTLGDTMEMLATVLLYTLMGIAAYLLGCWIGKN